MPAWELLCSILPLPPRLSLVSACILHGEGDRVFDQLAKEFLSQSLSLYPADTAVPAYRPHEMGEGDEYFNSVSLHAAIA